MIRTLIVTVLLSVSTNADYCTSKCRRSRIHGMQSADCYNVELREIPQCLNTNIEILELSMNRIRNIKRGDLNRYSNLKYLYLQDNMITNIDEEALADKSSLETLDISLNAFHSVPPVVFHLPSLRTLYMNQNQNINIVDDIEKAKPIVSPLVKIDIGYNTFKQLPNFGVLPTLVFYNISGNTNVQMNTTHFAGLCKLETLVTENFTARFEQRCDCTNLKRWLEERMVKFNFNCEPADDCRYGVPDEDIETYEECVRSYEREVSKSRLVSIVVPIVVGIAVVILVGIVYVYVRRRRKGANENKGIKKKYDSQVLL